MTNSRLPSEFSLTGNRSHGLLIPASIGTPAYDVGSVVKEMHALQATLHDLMDDVKNGDAKHLFSDPNHWTTFSHDGPPTFQYSAAKLNSDFILSLMRIGACHPSVAKPLRLEKEGALLEVNKGKLLVYDRESIKADRKPTELEVGERREFGYPLATERVFAVGKDRPVDCTCVMSRAQMYSRFHDLDLTGFREMKTSKTLLSDFEFYNDPGRK